ncbi:MAG: thiamine pyrophosphate-binding protein [Clostridiales bacterium]|nr:thiamine pyrophosphate-binding protein [Clostridiales bacterium]
MISLAEGLVTALKDLGVKYVFGIPGGPSIPYMNEMKKQGIEFITTANEQSAGMMADVFGRLTGIPGVCHSTFGAGATNLSTGVGGAWLDRSPLIALTTEFKDEDLGRRIQMNMDQQAFMAPITKWTTRIDKDNFSHTLSKAFSVALSENPGPVHIGLQANTHDDVITSNDIKIKFETAKVPLPDQMQLKTARAVFASSRKPILAIGLTAFRHGLSKEIKTFIEEQKLPVVITPMAKGMLHEDHPSYAGVLFHAKSNFVANIYRQADLVIGIGYDSVEFNYETWMPNVPLIHLDTEPLDITKEYKETYEVIGDLKASLDFLNSFDSYENDWNLDDVAQNKIRMFEALSPMTDSFNPSQALEIIREVLPLDGILTADVGAHLHLIGQLWRMGEKGTLLMTNGWSSMGFGIPSAIGAKLCKPYKTVVCVTGDGGFLMNCGELMVARRLGLNIVVVVLVDNEYSLIKVKQEWKTVDQYATTVLKGNYFDADIFLGVPVYQARDEKEMRNQLKDAITKEGPVIIEAFVDGSIYSDMIVKDHK